MGEELQRQYELRDEVPKDKKKITLQELLFVLFAIIYTTLMGIWTVYLLTIYNIGEW